MIPLAFISGVPQMTRSTSSRRDFLTGSLAVSALALSGLGARAATQAGSIFPRPFVGSRTVSNFASILYWYEDQMPAALRRALDNELARTDVPIDSVAQETSSAKLFASLAMRMIAPRSLRRAGYEALAVACENERDHCPGGAAALAQHMIGREFSSMNTPWPASSAYGACAHASTCAFYAGQDEIETVIQAGTYTNGYHD